jgi:phosphoribosylformimino-5-aminoimidazole carboxamide ribotide isomerase
VAAFGCALWLNEGSHVLIIPAIDLRGGQCVRLRQGDYAQETIFGSDPVSIARRWVREGARFLHIVDLDGAKGGRPHQTEAIRRIIGAVEVPCQVGGGIRTEADIARALEWGSRRVIVGSKALDDLAWLERACRSFPGKVVLGIDAKGGKVATEGWLNLSDRGPLDFARQCAALPLAAIVYTDIGQDGMLRGPNLQAIEQMTRAVPIPIIASGGITTLDDVARVARLNVSGCIIGRALYEGRINLAEAIRIAGDGVVNGGIHGQVSG